MFPNCDHPWPGCREIGVAEAQTTGPVGASGASAAPGSALPAEAQTPVARTARLPEFIGTQGGAAAISARLADATLIYLGAGSVGLPAILNSARLGIGTLVVIDPGTTKPESLLTHPLLPEAIGQPKAVLAGRMAKAIHPGSRVFVYEGPVEELPLTAFDGADLVILASDNLAAEAETGRRCTYTGTPLLQGSVHGETLVTQIRVFANAAADGSGPCPACQFGDQEWDHLQNEVIFSCAGGESFRSASTNLSADVAAHAEKVAQPTMSTAFLCSLSSDLLLLQATRQLLGLGTPPTDALIEYAGFGHAVTVSPLGRNEDCRLDHTRRNCIVCPGELHDRSLRELIEATGRPPNGGAVTVDGFSFAEEGICRCDTDRAIGRFVRVEVDRDGDDEESGDPPAPLCPECGAAIIANDFFSHRDVPLDLLTDVLDTRLSDLGVDGTDSVRVRAGDQLFELRPG